MPDKNGDKENGWNEQIPVPGWKVPVRYFFMKKVVKWCIKKVNHF